MGDTWLSFWQEKNAFDDSMSINYAYFLKKVEQHISVDKSIVVLDIGSGPGHLEDAWHNRVKEIHAVDVSVRYNTMVREKHKAHPNVFIYDLPADNYLNLFLLGATKFDLVIVMSVLQYYRNKEEVISLLQSIKNVVAPGATLLLCDLMADVPFHKEVMQILKDAVRERKLLSIVSLLFKLRFSRYYKIKKQSGFLILKDEEWLEIFNRLQLKATYIKEPITLQKNRKSVMIQF